MQSVINIANKNYVGIDVFDFTYIDRISGESIFEGNMKKSGIKQKTDKIDIFAGIGNNKISSIKNKKDITIDGSIATFNPKYFAAMNGVNLDLDDNIRLYIKKSVPVTTNSATIKDAVRIHAVMASDGSTMKVVTTEPQNENEVKFEGNNKLTLKTGSTASELLVTYEAPQEAGKAVATVIISGKAFPRSGKFIFNTDLFDIGTDEKGAELQGMFHKVLLGSDWDLSFDAGKAMDIPLKMEVLLAETIDGKDNRKAKELGYIKFVEDYER